MPPIALAVLAHAAGLVAGFGLSGRALALAAAGAPAVALWLWRRGVLPLAAAGALLALLAAGIASATLAQREGRACLARAATAREWRVALVDAAAPGRSVRAEQVAPGGCALAVTAMLRRGSGEAGAVVVVRGRPAPAGRGLVVRDAGLDPTRERRLLLVWRARAARSIDGAFGADAPVARALLVGDTRDIPVALRDRFAAAGLVHVLSISGLHVAILASALELLLGALRAPPAVARVAACALAWLYVAVIGLPPPAVRAATMLTAAAASRALQRPTSPWGALALGAAAPLLASPVTILDLGFQLSVVGMAALIAGGEVARRHLRGRLRGWRLTVARELATSTIATAVTAPLVAWWFGQVSLAGPLANLAAAPVVAILQPTLFLALLAAPAPGAARFVAGAAHPLLALLDGIAGAAAALPGTVLHVAPTLATALVLGVAALAALAACVSAHPARGACGVLLAAAAAAWLPDGPMRPTGRVELHMLDVGQGDALALRTPMGRWILFDAGPAWRTGDAGRRVVVPYLRRRGGTVAAFVLSHPHLDHVGGAPSAIEALRPARYWDAGFPAGGERYRASLGAAAAGRVRWQRARPGDSAVVDGVTVRFLAPDSAWAASLDDANNASTVALVRYGAVRFLLVGDAEAPEEAWLLAHARASLRADVLKVAHHGSRTSTTPAFLAAVRPRVALVSVGLGNDYGHPNADVLDRLADAGAEVLRTDLLGTVVVHTDGHSLTVTAADQEWPVSSPASPAGWPPP